MSDDQKDDQVNIKCRKAQKLYWQGAAQLAGYGDGRFSQWVKRVLTAAANHAYDAADRGLKPDPAALADE